MGKNEFSMRELYDCLIKTTYPIEMNGRKIEQGEVIAYFDSIQLANFQEIVTKVAATGGWDNRAHVIWESPKEIDLVFTSGIFSKSQLALMTNAKLVQSAPESIEIHKREELESDENGKIELSYPARYDLFIYDLNGEKLQWTAEDNEFKKFGLGNENAYKDVIVDYYYMYENGSSTLKIGNQLLTNFVQLEAKTRVKDDVTGQVHTGIIRIPKMKIMSDFSIRLGKQANPHVDSLKAIGLPVGERHNSQVATITFLEDDIDSDI